MLKTNLKQLAKYLGQLFLALESLNLQPPRFTENLIF